MIDPTEYVEAPEGVQSLKFSNEKQQAKFELGVCMAVYKWDELTTAVENLWGGPNSAEKRDWLSGVVIELFDEKAVDLVLIEETLLFAMVDEFDTEIDNDSALEIADLVMKIYKDCNLEQYERVDALYEAYQRKSASRAQSQAVVVGADPNNPDSSDADDDDDDDDEDHTPALTQGADDSMDVDERSGPTVDDAGFELVTRRKR